MMPKNLPAEARNARHRQAYQRMKSDPARWAKEVERKRRDTAARKARRAMNLKPMLRAINADLYRQHGPWAQLFVMQSNTKVLTSKVAG
jgi:hypothetical protein